MEDNPTFLELEKEGVVKAAAADSSTADVRTCIRNIILSIGQCFMLYPIFVSNNCKYKNNVIFALL